MAGLEDLDVSCGAACPQLVREPIHPSMPKRSNEFQDLIELLERQLAPPGAKVFASRLLEDSITGEDREVDVVIETMSGVHPIRIGIEVTEQRRRVPVTWIEAMFTKHAHLPINKSIAVSSSGFSRSALRKAEDLKIDALTLEEATKLDWQARIDSLPFVRLVSFLRPYLTGVTVVFAEERSMAAFEGCDLSTHLLYTPAGESRGTLLSAAERLLGNENVVGEIEQRAFTDAATVIEGEFRLQKGLYILGPKDERHRVSRIRLKARCKKEIGWAQLRKGRYRDTAVVLASGRWFDHPLRMVFSETRDDKDLKVSVRIQKKRGT